MSEKKNKGRYARKSKVKPLMWVVAIVAVLAVALLIWALNPSEDTRMDETRPAVTEPVAEKAEVSVQEGTLLNLDDGLMITDIGKYTGIYMEDGSDELVTGVLMIVVKNTVDRTLQYAEITVPTAAGDALFKLTTLPSGESVVLLEQNRMQWSADEEYDIALADNIAFFTQEPTLLNDQLKFQLLNGAFNVTNISGEDITEDIVIYYKNAAEDLYYGGITYRIRIEGGINAGELKQVMGNHLSDSGSKIMFATAN